LFFGLSRYNRRDTHPHDDVGALRRRVEDDRSAGRRPLQHAAEMSGDAQTLQVSAATGDQSLADTNSLNPYLNVLYVRISAF